ncbi:MAG: hypothetical protein FJW24_09135 [Acidimicrobiia bacterium]|nr:hypothetical protein [Acidimicrobiia bacterium]
MSKENAAAFIRRLEAGDGAEGVPPDPTPSDIVTRGRNLGFEFTEADLGSVLRERLFAAQSLPLGWGWPVARKLGLVRS